MLKKKSASRDNKRKHQSDEQNVDRKHRGTESSVEVKDESADVELDKVASDIEEGGLDLGVPFKPISAYIAERQEMLDQCFHVLGEKKLMKMLPDELKSCSMEEIKNLCQEQLDQLSPNSLLQILAGEELTASSGGEEEGKMLLSESQQDNIVDSTSSLKETGEAEDSKRGDAGSDEESDVLSINADADDSDIEGHKDKQPDPKPDEAAEVAEVVAIATPPDPAPAPDPSTPQPGGADKPDKPVEAKKELETDIDKSVSEILALGSTLSCREDSKAPVEPAPAEAPEAPVPAVSLPAQTPPVPGPAPAACQPSVQQLELLELEMRARAIKALMKANEVKKPP